MENGDSTVARFEKASRVRMVDGERRDFHYNGLLSLEREKNLCGIVRNEAMLPAPKVYGIHHTEEGSFMLVEKLPGVHWKEFLDKKSYDLDSYLNSLRFLGADIAQVQQVLFHSYGDVVNRNEVQPSGITSFVERLRAITDLRLQRAEMSGALNEQQLDEVRRFFECDFGYLEKKSGDSRYRPVFVLADIHPMNFLVDDKGKPSGYFDLEFCQSGVPSLEFYAIKFGLFSYFDYDTFQKAEATFFDGFESNGGEYQRDDSTNLTLERTLSVSSLLDAVTSYYGASDGLRDTWSEQFRHIMFVAIQKRIVDYLAIADVLRSKTRQPKHPNIRGELNT